MKPALPLHRYPFVSTRSLEEAAHIQSGVNAPLALKQIDRRTAFRWEANRAFFGQLGLMTSRYGAGLHACSPGLAQHFSLIVPLHTGGSVMQGRTTAALAPGRGAALCSPSVRTEIALGSGYEGETVAIPMRVLENMLTSLTG